MHLAGRAAIAAATVFALAQAQDPAQQSQDSKVPAQRDSRSPDRGGQAGGSAITRGPLAATVTGTVALQGGGSFPNEVTVQSFCGGMAGEAVKTRGRFRVVVGQTVHTGAPPGVVQGAMACEVRASLSGFQPATHTLHTIPAMGIDIGILVLRPLHGVTGYTFSVTTALAPKEARKAYEKGLRLSAENKPQTAIPELQRAVGIYPAYAMAWFELGTAFHRLNRSDEARMAYTKSAEADRKFMKPVLQLAMLSAAERKWKETSELTGRVTASNPFEFPQAWLYHAVGSYNLGDLATAEKSVRRAIELDPHHQLPKTHQLLGTIQADQKETRRAIESLTAYLTYAPKAPDAAAVRSRIAELEALLK